MPPVAPQPVQITCPACGTPYRAGIYTLVDVTQQPELKAALLGGQLNVAVCSNCNTATMLGAPMVYHDAEKQQLLVYFPQELNASPQDQERFVGEATSFLMRSLPPEMPRGYLLAPKRFLTLPSLLDAVLEADGISRETLDRQRAHVELISQLAERLPDPEGFAALVDERRADLTPELFATLAAFIEATPPAQADSRELLMQVHERLLGQLGDAEAPSDAEVEDAVEALVTVAEDELELVVAERLDYGFFEAWTARIEAAEPAEAARLTTRRARILEIVEELDLKAQELFEAGSLVLREVIEAEDPQAALAAQAERIDEAFLMVLSANAAAAQRAGRDDLVAVFEQLGDAAMEIIQARLSPEERFINELLMVETPQEATKLLRKSVAKITPELVRRLNELADQEEKRTNKPTADRLRQLARECGAMLF
jgi:CpXC protein